VGRRDECAGGDALPVVHLVGEVVLELNHGELLELIVRDVLVQRRREHGGDVVHAVRKHHAVALLSAFGLVLERAKICGGAVSGGGRSADLGKPHALRTRRERWSRRGCAARVTRAPRRVPSGRAQARRFVSRARHAPAIWSTGCNPTSPWYSCMVDPMVRSNSLSPMAERTRVAERPSRCGAAFSRCDLERDATAVLTRRPPSSNRFGSTVIAFLLEILVWTRSLEITRLSDPRHPNSVAGVRPVRAPVFFAPLRGTVAATPTPRCRGSER
jgi:hypothetical protein